MDRQTTSNNRPRAEADIVRGCQPDARTIRQRAVTTKPYGKAERKASGVMIGREVPAKSVTLRWRAEGPAPYQPGPKRAGRVRAAKPFYAGTGTGPGLAAKTERGLKARSIGHRFARFGAGLSALSHERNPPLGVAQGWHGAGP